MANAVCLLSRRFSNCSFTASSVEYTNGNRNTAGILTGQAADEGPRLFFHLLSSLRRFQSSYI